MAVITETYLRSEMLKGTLSNPYFISHQHRLTPAAQDFLRDRGIKIEVMGSNSIRTIAKSKELRIPVGVSNRHVHLSHHEVEVLFGKGYELTPYRSLSQPGQFAAEETVTLVGPKGVLSKVRILGPARELTQVEISRTDGFTLGIHPPVRLSGSIEGTPGITLVGKAGSITISQGVIVAKSHVHMSPNDAKEFNVKDGDRLIVQAISDRSIIFPEVVVRVNERFTLDFHIDTDEANAANLKTGDFVKVIGRNGEPFSVNA
ncbi:propanediol utilization protein [Geobacillus thermocatenulatus]|uniref:Phosphate propanoyltransferase n=1 Tax=Geobacillus thermocatenulatus TaxID=33938 RepID=A0A226QDM9_9BACL|nr:MULTISPECIES: phosphate propanoyltransferase [Geobacillus]ASS99256.1 propanediol utilization protein [Geobacillus thermocatenulatus]KLR73309.1 propanediol utilization phosphotransacylase [Geobacillus sp. T6]KPD00473.1 Phosphate propanoyltransferase [Geobacillus sp. BCO2]OXB89988.1 propanediol utilization protein [Geobacillus thermocatenulatus]